MKNKDGLYEVYKFIVATNDTITATGKTPEEAKANLKNMKKDYRNGNSMDFIGTFKSPGFEVKGPVGNRNYEKNPNRVGYTWSRKDLAKFLREERKQNE